MKVSPHCRKAAHSLDPSVTKNNNVSCIRYTFGNMFINNSKRLNKKRHKPGRPSVPPLDFRATLTATQHGLRVLIRYTIRADAIENDASSPNRIPTIFSMLTSSKLTKPPQIESQLFFSMLTSSKLTKPPQIESQLFF